MRVTTRQIGVREDERGYTLPEVLTAVAIVAILLALAIIVLLALLERWRVEAAAEQFAADLRLAHARATGQPTDWGVVFTDDGTPVGGCSAADYCLVKLDAPYGVGDPTSTPDGDPLPRRLPERTKIKGVTFDPDCSHGDPGAVVAPGRCGPGATSTLEFNFNGTVTTLRPGQSGAVVIGSEDGSPTCRIVFNAPTSRITIGDITY